MKIEILEPAIVIVYADALAIPSPIVEGVEFGQLLKGNIINPSWGFEDSVSNSPFQRETFLKNGLTFSAEPNKLVIRHDSFLHPNVVIDLVEIAKNAIAYFKNLTVKSVGINFQVLLETGSNEKKIDDLFFDVVKQKIKSAKFSSGMAKLVFECDNSKLNFSMGLGTLFHSRKGVSKNGIVVDANFHTDWPSNNYLSLKDLLETQATKKKILQEILKELIG